MAVPSLYYEKVKPFSSRCPAAAAASCRAGLTRATAGKCRARKSGLSTGYNQGYQTQRLSSLSNVDQMLHLHRFRAVRTSLKQGAQAAGTAQQQFSPNLSGARTAGLLPSKAFSLSCTHDLAVSNTKVPLQGLSTG